MPDQTFDITLQPSAERYPAGAGETILQALERGGLEFPAFCRHGHCGLCRAQLLSGTHAPDSTQPADGLMGTDEILICASRPTADLELRLFWGLGRAPEIPARVTEFTPLSSKSHRLKLRLPVVQPFTFKPGQFVLLRLSGLVRAYALTNPPHERDPELHIRPTPGGMLEQALTGLKPGDLVTIEGPCGQFYYRPTTAFQSRRTLLVAGGMGYAPLKSILRHIHETVDESYPGEIELVWEAATGEDLYDHVWLRRLAAEWTRFHYHPVVGHPDTGQTIPVGTAPDALTRTRVAGAICYLAGAGAMVNASMRKLLSLGVPENAIYRESFGADSGSVRSDAGSP